MLKKHMAACLVATAFAVAPAFAQTATTPSGSTDRPAASGSGSTTTGSSAMQPGSGSTMAPATGSTPMTPAPGSSSAPATGSSTMGAAPPAAGQSTMGAAPAAPGSSTMAQSGGMQGQFMTQMQGEQMMASSLIGTTVVSTNNESIGDVNDVILDRNGQVLAVVVGVGGFLGIGEKDVAVPFKSLEFASREQATAMNNTAAGGTGTMASGTAAGSNVNTTGSTAGATNRSTATTGNTGGNGASAAPDSAAGNASSPDRVVLRMTKAELQSAPSFRTSGGSTASGSTTAPKP